MAGAASATLDANFSIGQRIADYLAAAPAMPLSPDVAAKARQHLLDTIAAMVSGAHLAPGKIAISYAGTIGGTPVATVVGSELRTDVVTAALANGMCAHADETDDFHVGSITHPGCAVVPAALALAEADKASGAALLRAVVAGYEICCRMVMAIDADRTFREGRATHAIGGLFGASAASAVVLGLPAAQIPHLMSYAAQQAAGLVCWRRDPDHIEKACDFAGIPARNGVQIATMVAHGMTGVADAMEGNHGFFPVFGRGVDPAPAWQTLGETSMIMEAAIKRWCVGSPVQAALDAVEILRSETHFDANDIAAVTVRLPSDGAQVVDNGPMPNVNCQHLVALALTDGELTFESSHDHARMSDPKVQALRARTTLIHDDALVGARPPRQAVVEVALGDGRRLRHHARAVRGTPDNPMTWNEVAAKAQDLMEPVLGASQSESIIAAVADIEAIGNAGELARLLSSGTKQYRR
jgi:2-methylcitrate dehydratase PrpD